MNSFNPRLIFLIGFMGAGKSYTGKHLAEKMQLPFFDMDEYIEGKAGMTIPEIFQEKGEEAFRILERKCLRDFAVIGNAVVATGGGAPCFFDNMEWMNEHGVTIYLRTSPALLHKRLLPEKDNRPLLKDLDSEGLLEFIDKKIEDRAVFYEKASVIVDQKEDGENVMEEIFRNFTNITGH